MRDFSLLLKLFKLLAFEAASSKLTSLQECYLRDNQLEGKLPTQMGSLGASLRYFDARENQFTGKIPTQVGKLTSLRHFYLTRNHFSGAIPSEIGLLDNLSKFRVGK